MAVRLTKIYTRTGDAGNTRLADGSERSKSDIRINLLGEVDELNSCVGIVVSKSKNSEVNIILTSVSGQLFDIGADICKPGFEGKRVSSEYIYWLERKLDHLNENLPTLKSFILPGGSEAGASCHFARSVCRRAERTAVICYQGEDVNPKILEYLNRLSDLLFVCARAINGVDDEVLWEPGLNFND